MEREQLFNDSIFYIKPSSINNSTNSVEDTGTGLPNFFFNEDSIVNSKNERLQAKYENLRRPSIIYFENDPKIMMNEIVAGDLNKSLSPNISVYDSSNENLEEAIGSVAVDLLLPWPAQTELETEPIEKYDVNL